MSPKDGVVKINTDGSFKGSTGMAAAGGVLRDANGNWVGAFVMNVGPSNVENAELWGMLKGLDLAWRKGYRRVVIEWDNTTVVDYILGDNHNIHVQGPLVQLVKQILNRNWHVQVSKIWREGNGVADFLAKKAHQFDRGIHYFEQPHVDVIHLLDFDRNGGIRSRFCIM